VSDLPSYDREKVTPDKRATCPCCLRAMRVAKNGTMVRHGWEETGRRVGEWGRGFQWGNCHGWHKRPIEQTDKDGRYFRKLLREQVAALDVEIAKHEQRKIASYRHGWSFATFGSNPETAEGVATALTAAGFKATTKKVSLKRKGHRVYYVDGVEVDFSVSVGDENRPVTYDDTLTVKDRFNGDVVHHHVPGYEEVRRSYLGELSCERMSLARQADAIEGTIRATYAKPSNGAVDTKNRGPVVHFEHYPLAYSGERRKVIACRSRAFSVLKTEKRDEVTCKRCLKRLGRG